jgi:hypothetical protein
MGHHQGVCAVTTSCTLTGKAAILGLTLFMMDSPAAHAHQQSWASQYVNWRLSDPTVTEVWNVDQDVWIPRTANSSFWPLVWDWKGSDSGGYLGLQQQGDGKQNVRFSIWDAKAAEGPNCRTFDGEGLGYTCVRNLTIDTEKFYRYRLYRLTTEPDGQWWGGWLIETDAKGALVEHYIGRIKAPAGTRSVDPGQINNFVEYFGDAVRRCKNVPLSIAGLAPPAVNYGGKGTGIYGGYTLFDHSTKAAGNHCTDGNQGDGAIITAVRDNHFFVAGIMMFMGGTAAQHETDPIRYPTPLELPDS